MRLFAPIQVVVATLLGSPVGGVVLLALNARTRGRSILPAVAPALLGTTLLTVVGAAIPGLRYAVAALSVAMMGGLAHRANMDHPAPAEGPWGVVFGVSFVGIVVLLALVVPVVLVYERWGASG